MQKNATKPSNNIGLGIHWKNGAPFHAIDSHHAPDEMAITDGLNHVKCSNCEQTQKSHEAGKTQQVQCPE